MDLFHEIFEMKWVVTHFISTVGSTHGFHEISFHDPHEITEIIKAIVEIVEIVIFFFEKGYSRDEDLTMTEVQFLQLLWTLLHH